MVLSIHGFNGAIRISGNTFLNNMAFIPTAILTGQVKARSVEQNFEEFIDDSGTLRFHSGDQHFMNHLDMVSWSDQL